MSIQDEIYEKFFSKLSKIEDFPPNLIDDLKEMLKMEKEFSQEKLIELLTKYSDDAKDKKDKD